ncbi:beta-galactosidase [Candidatus Aminicenantes bacterium AC-334-K16]|nr:beta-galactosidase [Candidatus Aminicenantes bacterium AC-334-K16]
MNRRDLLLGRWLVFVGLVLVIVSCRSSEETFSWKPARGPLFTHWGEKVSPQNVWNVYPRPQLQRRDWLNLNGLWDYVVLPVNEGPPEEYQGKILVPFPIESSLSGVGQKVSEKEKVWYRRLFSLPPAWREKKVYLHFEASDWETTVWVNGQEVGTHRGGYDPFSFDISAALKGKGKQELVVAVWDPTDKGFQPRGKQVQNPHGIWYTAVTGLWGTVWLEPLNETHIDHLQIIPDIDKECVQLKINITSPRPELKIKASVQKGDELVTEKFVSLGEELIIPVTNPHLWSPEDPFLYQLRIRIEEDGQLLDEIQSYFGMRKISLDRDTQGRTRIFLNNRPYFQLGTLDQGFWPDGIYTAPTEKAWVYDLEVLKKLGFNMVRKHVKVEPRRYYYWCDRLGILVWQDMPSGDQFIKHNEPDIKRTKESAEQFKLELKCLINNLFNHPSVVVWVLFNEGWGQFETETLTEWVKSLDPTRLVDSASGWVDRGGGDIKDIHAYPGPAMPSLESKRAVVLGEFGGLGLPVPYHIWQKEKSWGYRTFSSYAELTQGYVDLIKKLKFYVHQGLSAAVYTQTSDVETEVNGLLTYDRNQVKVYMDKVAAANREVRRLKD